MKCIICSRKTENENEICDKCLKKQQKEELKNAKKNLAKAKFEQVDQEHNPEYGRMVYTTGMRSAIISLIASISALMFSFFIVPGFIFGLLGFVEGIITLVDVIRNNKRGHRRMIPLAFGVIGMSGSIIACISAFLSLLSIIIFLTLGRTIFILALIL